MKQPLTNKYDWEELFNKMLKDKAAFNLGSISNLCQCGILYHYTTINSLENILNKNTFWLSKSDYLNDSKEIKYSLCLIRKVLERYTSIQEATKSKMLNILYSAEDYLNNAFIFSLSKNADSLTLWSNYSKTEGYNLGINAAALAQAIHGDNAFVVVDAEKPLPSIAYKIQTNEVIYDPKVQEQAIEDIIEVLNQLLRSSGTHQDVGNYLNLVIDFLFKCLIFFKDPCFKAEEEFRVVFILESEKYKNKIIKHRILNGAFIPYIEIRFSKDGRKIPIENITIGPRNNADIAKKGMESFLADHGFKNVTVTKSNIPLRY